jgi:hypothetical protein
MKGSSTNHSQLILVTGKLAERAEVRATQGLASAEVAQA